MKSGSQPTWQLLPLLPACIDGNQLGLTRRGSPHTHERDSAAKYPRCMRNIFDGYHHLRSPQTTFEDYVAPFRSTGTFESTLSVCVEIFLISRTFGWFLRTLRLLRKEIKKIYKPWKQGIETWFFFFLSQISIHKTRQNQEERMSSTLSQSDRSNYYNCFLEAKNVKLMFVLAVLAGQREQGLL